MALAGLSQGSGFTSKLPPPVLPSPVPLISYPSLGTKTAAETAELPEAQTLLLPGVGKPQRSRRSSAAAVGLSHPTPAQPGPARPSLQPTARPPQPPRPLLPRLLSSSPGPEPSRGVCQAESSPSTGASSAKVHLASDGEDARLRYRIFPRDGVVAAGTSRGVLEKGGTMAASAGGQVGHSQDNISALPAEIPKNHFGSSREESEPRSAAAT